MADANDTRELVAALLDDREVTINDLPKELLMSIFVVIGDERWVRHTIHLVREGWAAL